MKRRITPSQTSMSVGYGHVRKVLSSVLQLDRVNIMPGKFSLIFLGAITHESALFVAMTLIIPVRQMIMYSMRTGS